MNLPVLKNIDLKKILNIENLIYIFIIFFLFGVDRFSKYWVINNLNDKNIIWLNDFTNLDLIWNTGVGFGLLNFEANLTYHIISLIIILIIFYVFYLFMNSISVEKALFTLIISGAVGNLYDRVTYFAVPDFVDLHFNNFHWFTFNIADIFITTGIIGLLIRELRKK